MENKLGVALKILLLSLGLALAIKYLAPQFNIPATPANAIVAVILPTLLLVGALTWRLQTTKLQR